MKKEPRKIPLSDFISKRKEPKRIPLLNKENKNENHRQGNQA